MRISTLITTASLATVITAASFVSGLRTAEPPLVLASSSPLPTSVPSENVQTEIPESPVTQEPEPLKADVRETAEQKVSPEPTQDPAPSTPAPPQEPQVQPVVQEVMIDSDPIEYMYGVVQLRLAMLGQEITNVTVLQGDTSYGRDVAYATLVAATLQYQSTNYGNVSGATFTTEAFKLAVESALAKS